MRILLTTDWRRTSRECPEGVLFGGGGCCGDSNYRKKSLLNVYEQGCASMHVNSAQCTKECKHLSINKYKARVFIRYFMIPRKRGIKCVITKNHGRESMTKTVCRFQFSILFIRGGKVRPLLA